MTLCRRSCEHQTRSACWVLFVLRSPPDNSAPMQIGRFSTPTFPRLVQLNHDIDGLGAIEAHSTASGHGRMLYFFSVACGSSSIPTMLQ